jgi:hypothetical protein
MVMLILAKYREESDVERLERIVGEDRDLV